MGAISSLVSFFSSGVSCVVRLFGRCLDLDVPLVLYGQTVALSLACTSAASSTLEFGGAADVPLLRTGMAYAALAAMHLSRFPRRKTTKAEKRDPIGDGDESGGESGALLPKMPSDDGDEDEGIKDNGGGCGGDGGGHTVPFTNLSLRSPYVPYVLLSLLDVESNYLTLLAYRYAPLASASLFGTLAVPSAMAFSYVLLGRRYGSRHFAGAALSGWGAAVMMLSDGSSDSSSSSVSSSDAAEATTMTTAATAALSSPLDAYPLSLLGDALALCAAVLYGLTDTLGEYFVRNASRTEYLGMLGLNGLLVCLVQSALLGEWSELSRLLGPSSSSGEEGSDAEETLVLLGALLWYVTSLTYFYVSASKFLETAGASSLCLSLQTSEMYETAYQVAVQRVRPTVWFYPAAGLALLGVLIYETGGETERRQRTQQHNDGDCGAEEDVLSCVTWNGATRMASEAKEETMAWEEEKDRRNGGYGSTTTRRGASSSPEAELIPR